MSDQLTIIFVAGAFHTNFHLQPITPHLEARNYRLVPIQLPTTGAPEPWPVMQDNVDLISNTLQSETAAGHRVILIAHSVAGQPTAAAIETFLQTSPAEQKAKVVHMIFIACFWNPFRPFSESAWFEVDWDSMWAKLTLPAHEVFYNTMKAADAQPFVDALGVFRAQMPADVTGEWNKAAKGTYFLCAQDRAVPAKFQRPEAEENRLELVELDMDHCPMVSRPEELAERIDEVSKVYK